MLTGKVLKDGVWYYLTSSGAMATGWVQDAAGAWYLASTDASDGRLQTGWQKSNGSWYWLDPATSKMTTGWFEQGGSTYCLCAPNGNMLASAWVDDENGHRWLGSDGALVATVVGNRIVYADASHAKTQAEALQAQYDARLKAANAEGDRIIQNATRQAQEREEAIVHEAQEKAARTMERAHAQVEREKKQAMNDLKDQVSGMAIGIASAVLEEDVDKRKHAKLIDSFIENLGEPL